MFLKKRKSVGLFIVMVSLACNGCYYDKEELLYPAGSTPAPSACSAVPASFSADVLPLITSKCAVPGCHDAAASGGLILQNYSQISAAKDAINTRAIIQKTMPPAGPLSTDETNKLRCWIESGALNN